MHRDTSGQAGLLRRCGLLRALVVVLFLHPPCLKTIIFEGDTARDEPQW